MVHELLGIEKNRVVINKELQKLKDAQKESGVKPKADEKVRVMVGWHLIYTWQDDVANEVVMSAEQDDFYKANMYANFGEVGELW